MKNWILILNIFWLAQVQAAECFVFPKLERESQVSALKITLGPAQNPRSAENFRIAQLSVKDANGDDLSGQVGCTKSSANLWNCQRSDDGGSFELEVDGGTAKFSAYYFVMGSDEDKLTLQSEKDDPWVFEGQACGAVKQAPPTRPQRRK